MLNGCRALDLTDENGFLCGKILADLGVDVIKVERPGGDRARRIGPFWADIPHQEKSLYWFAYNSNKRGITLNIETADGREILKGLVKTADFVMESFPPGFMDNLGLGYSTLSSIKKGIILASITPFGHAAGLSSCWSRCRRGDNDCLLPPGDDRGRAAG
jgi:benzylsuccinate CoA-transferase BbsE subunit